MDIGIVGLGRMGGNMARRLARGGVRVTGFDPDPNARGALAADSVTGNSLRLERSLSLDNAGQDPERIVAPSEQCISLRDIR